MPESPRLPNTIGQNAAAYGRTKVPRSRRSRRNRLAAVGVVVAVAVAIYLLTR